MKAKAYAYMDFSCTVCGADFTDSGDNPWAVRHPGSSGRVIGKDGVMVPGTCPFAGKTFKVPVFELEEV